jgi:hypothetical protein
MIAEIRLWISEYHVAGNSEFVRQVLGEVMPQTFGNVTDAAVSRIWSDLMYGPLPW